mgnify:CR=1 FL=1
MTEEVKNAEGEAEVQKDEGTETDWKAMNDELNGKIAQLEEGIASRDGELAAIKKSLASAVAKYRAAVIASAPEVPEELVKGETVEEIDASLSLAQSIVSKVKQTLEAQAQSTPIPAGAPPRQAPDLEGLPGTEKIKYGLQQRR